MPPMKIVNNETRLVAVDSIRPHESNVNEGNLGAIAESIQQSGFYGSVIVQKSTGKIVAGNHRWMSARQLGAAEIPVTFIDVDDETALRILIADNRTTRLGVDNSQSLADLLTELADTDAGLAGTGFSGDDLDDLLSDLSHLSPPPRRRRLRFWGTPTPSLSRPRLRSPSPAM